MSADGGATNDVKSVENTIAPVSAEKGNLRRSSRGERQSVGATIAPEVKNLVCSTNENVVDDDDDVEEGATNDDVAMAVDNEMLRVENERLKKKLGFGGRENSIHLGTGTADQTVAAKKLGIELDEATIKQLAVQTAVKKYSPTVIVKPDDLRTENQVTSSVSNIAYFRFCLLYLLIYNNL